MIVDVDHKHTRQGGQRTIVTLPPEGPADFSLWRAILEVARSSPSPHNVQPWRVRLVSSRRAELYIDGTRTLPNEDFTGCFVLSAMGMSLEALDLTARQNGFRLDYRLMDDIHVFAGKMADSGSRGLTLFALIELSYEPGRAILFSAADLLARSTSRLSLMRKQIPEEAVAKLTLLASEWGHRYTHLTDERLIEEGLDHNITAVLHDMNHPPYHDEIASWFRFSPRAAAAHRDGLDWRCMNLSRAEFWMLARLPQMLKVPLARTLFRRRYRKQLGYVPAIGVLSGPFFEAEHTIASGRFLLRFWLEVAALELYIHPYGNLVTNAASAEWTRQRTGIEKSWLIFKIGYSDVPPRSFRRTVEQILLGENEVPS
jgi:nitroreductase